MRRSLAAVIASLGSYPASTSSIRALSRTVRVIGPSVSRDGPCGIAPKRLTSCSVGFNATRLLCEAGPRARRVLANTDCAEIGGDGDAAAAGRSTGMARRVIGVVAVAKGRTGSAGRELAEI